MTSLITVKYKSAQSSLAEDYTSIVVDAPAADTGYTALCCVGAYVTNSYPGLCYSVTNISNSQVTIYASGWDGEKRITANTVWLYVRSN